MRFQAYATVVSAAEGNDPDSEHFGKVDEVKQYPSVLSADFNVRFGQNFSHLKYSVQSRNIVPKCIFPTVHVLSKPFPSSNFWVSSSQPSRRLTMCLDWRGEDADATFEPLTKHT